MLSELGSVYDPQINSVRQQQALIPQQTNADLQAADALRVQANDDILGGARRRGIGFSGIPLGEQARYNATVYAPQVLRVKNDAQNRAMSLEDMILGINERKNTLGQQLRQQDVDNDYRNQVFEFEKQKFGEQMAEQRRQAAAAAAASRSNLGGLLSGARAGAQTRPNSGQVTPSQADQMLFNQMFLKGDGSQWGDKELVSDYNATLKSARYGNARDKQKIQYYHSFRPDLFGASMPISTLSNGSRLTF